LSKCTCDRAFTFVVWQEVGIKPMIVWCKNQRIMFPLTHTFIRKRDVTTQEDFYNDNFLIIIVNMTTLESLFLLIYSNFSLLIFFCKLIRPLIVEPIHLNPNLWLRMGSCIHIYSHVYDDNFVMIVSISNLSSSVHHRIHKRYCL